VGVGRGTLVVLCTAGIFFRLEGTGVVRVPVVEEEGSVEGEAALRRV